MSSHPSLLSPQSLRRRTRRLRPAAPALLLAALVPLAAGCSSSDAGGRAEGTASSVAGAATAAGTGAYCDALEAAQSEWKGAGASLADADAATKFVETVKKIEAAAPAEVKSQWTSLESLYEKFTADKADLSALSSQLETLKSAATAIETHAQSTCQIDLSGS